MVSSDSLIAKLVERHLENASKKISHSIDEFVNAMRPEIEALVQQVVTDPMTGALNRHALFDNYNVAMLKQMIQDKQGAVAMFDLDHFKRINDNYGHPVGDAALMHVNRIAKQTLDEQDVLYRYGGEEFVIISKDPDTQAFKNRLKNFCDLLNKTELETATAMIKVTASVGVADLNVLSNAIRFSREHDDKELVTQLLEIPDGALYHAKTQGRNQIVEYKGDGFSLLHKGMDGESQFSFSMR